MRSLLEAHGVMSVVSSDVPHSIFPLSVDGLGEFVENHSHLPSEQLRERMLREIAAFVGDAPQHDDMTMILLKVDEAEEAVA